MPDVNDSELQAQVKLLRNLLEKKRLTQDKYEAELFALGVDPATVGPTISVAGDYVDRSRRGDTTICLEPLESQGLEMRHPEPDHSPLALVACKQECRRSVQDPLA